MCPDLLQNGAYWLQTTPGMFSFNEDVYFIFFFFFHLTMCQNVIYLMFFLPIFVNPLNSS